MRVLVTGASGLIGSALVPHLRGSGHEVLRAVRRAPAAADERAWDGAALDPALLDDVDAVVHLAGAGVAGLRWTRRHKAEVLRSRVDGTTAVARAVAAHGGRVALLSASAVGWYGDTGPRLVDETGPPGRGFLAETCRAWEASTRAAEDAGARVVHLRTGIVLSRDGGALRPQLLVFRAGLGAPLGSGEQWVPWITIRDEVRAVAHLLTADVAGPVNLVAPEPVTNREWTRALARALRRPALPVGVPRLALRAAIGQFANEGLLAGQRLDPQVLRRSGFQWQDPVLEGALGAVLRA